VAGKPYLVFFCCSVCLLFPLTLLLVNGSTSVVYPFVLHMLLVDLTVMRVGSLPL
jgi:hypothetical protein